MSLHLRLVEHRKQNRGSTFDGMADVKQQHRAPGFGDMSDTGNPSSSIGGCTGVAADFIGGKPVVDGIQMRRVFEHGADTFEHAIAAMVGIASDGADLLIGYAGRRDRGADCAIECGMSGLSSLVGGLSTFGVSYRL